MMGMKEFLLNKWILTAILAVIGLAILISVILLFDPVGLGNRLLAIIGILR